MDIKKLNSDKNISPNISGNYHPPKKEKIALSTINMNYPKARNCYDTEKYFSQNKTPKKALFFRVQIIFQCVFLKCFISQYNILQ